MPSDTTRFKIPFASLHALLEKTRDTVALFDRQMKILYISSSIEPLLGYTPDEYIQLENRFDLLHPDDQQQSIQLITTLLQTPGASATRQHRLKHKDGTYRWLEATITNLLDDPDVEAVLANFRDITERKQAEEERDQLLQREQQARQEAELEQMRLRSLFAQAPALIHILRGPDHVFEFFHPLGKELVGGRDLTGMKVREAVPEYEGQGYFELLDHVYQTGETYVGKEMRSLLRAADGTLIERFFDFIYQPWYDIDGKIAGILNFAVEVTDQVRARQQVEALAEALQRNQERLELAQAAGHIGTFEWNIQTNEVTWTKEEEALYGLSTGAFGGTQDHWAQAVHPDDLPNVQDAIEQAIAEHHELDTTFRITWPDQSIHWIYAKARTFYDTQGNPLRMIGVNMDITQQKEVEARKDEFISIASHEMKTPVASIKGFTQILHRLFSTRDDEQPLHFLARMDRQLDRLTKLINDLLDVSKMQTGKLEFHQELFDLDELIQETVENLQAATMRYQLTIEGRTEAHLLGDRDRIGQVLINLLTNAIKYSPNTDRVIVRLTNEMNQAKVSVQDFGIGIADAHHQKIFERFYQATRAEDKTYPGLGIGLYISNEIIKRHHGRMWVESCKGAGATFSFTLPLSGPLSQDQEKSALIADFPH